MRWRMVLAVVLMLPLLASGWVAPPPRLTPAQVERLKERDRLLHQANVLFKAKEPAKGAGLAWQALDIEREVFGEISPSKGVAGGLLESLASIGEETGDHAGQIRARRELLRLT